MRELRSCLLIGVLAVVLTIALGSVTLVTALTVSFAWDAPAPNAQVTILGYKVLRGVQAGGPYPDSIDAGNQTTASWTASLPDGIYYYVARTYGNCSDSSGGVFPCESGFSNEVSVTAQSGGSPSPGVILTWEFNETSGTTCVDTVGAHTGTITDGTWATGQYGNAVSLNGVSTYITTPDVNDLDITTSGTLTAWVYLTTLDKWHGIISKGTGNSEPYQNYAIEISPTNLIECVLGTSGGADMLAHYSVHVMAINTWTHVACTWGNGVSKLYVNGLLDSSAPYSFIPVVNTAPLEVGRFGGAYDYLAGRLDNVRIYNKELTITEVQNDRDNTGVLQAPVVTLLTVQP